MNINGVLELLGRERNIGVDYGYYEQIDLWHSWWRGCSPKFHLFLEKSSDGALLSRKLYSLKMAKKICEDWASLLLNEKTGLTVSCGEAQRFLLGKSGVLNSLRFWQRMNSLVERAFYSGTGVFLLRLYNLSLSENGGMTAGRDFKLGFECLPAQCVIPLSAEYGEITEAAFCSSVLKGGRQYLYLEQHTLSKNGYVIENRYFESKNNALSPAPLPPGMLPKIETGSFIPLFSVLRPNILNHLSESSGLGISVFADAIDCLEGVDLAFNNLCRDFKLGGKKVFLNRSMVQSDEVGRILTPDDLCRQLFLTVGERLPSDSQLIYEHNPELRVNDNVSGLQAQLNYLSFRCGLGSHHYKFDCREVKTATEYMGEAQALAQNVKKHLLAVDTAVTGAIRALLWAGNAVMGLNFDPYCPISLRFDDSAIVDTETERERDLRDVKSGVMLPHEYRMRWYSEDEATAKGALSTVKT